MLDGAVPVAPAGDVQFLPAGAVPGKTRQRDPVPGVGRDLRPFQQRPRGTCEAVAEQHPDPATVGMEGLGEIAHLHAVIVGCREARTRRALMYYQLFKNLLFAPVVRWLFRARIEGAENVPATGGAILASNHLAAGDTFVMPALLAPSGHVPRQGGAVHGQPGDLVEDHRLVPQGRRPGAAGPLRRPGEPRRAEPGAAGARRRRPGRHLPRRHPLTGRPAVQGTHRRGPDGPGLRRPGDPGGRRGHRARPHRAGHPVDLEAADRHRPAARLQRLRRPRRGPRHPALDHRRGHVRDPATVRPDLRRRPTARRSRAAP